ncbi:MAG: serine/threonine protein kinase [Deltaproteobacteria bacterium]|nr:serine/threonine protein kinase [Deltaproteobacteria bacterium]
MALRPRSVERRYVVGPTIANGPNAAVYRGSVEGTETVVAIKHFLPGHREAAVVRETAAVAALDHPNIVELIDVGQEGRSAFMIFEHIHGPSLAAILAALQRLARPMPVEIALGVGAAIARALAHLHERSLPDGRPLGLVHRDLRAENVLIARDGVPKLIGFGHALVAGHAAPPVHLGEGATVAPELALGEAGDARVDLFALGQLLDRLLPSLERDPELSAIIERAIAPEPESRLRSARELEKQLDRFRAARQIPVSSSAIAIFVDELMPHVPAPGAVRPGPMQGATLILPADASEAARAPRTEARPTPSVAPEERESGPPRKKRVERLTRSRTPRLPRLPSLPRPDKTVQRARLSLSIRMHRLRLALKQSPSLWLVAGGVAALIIAIGTLVLLSRAFGE